MRSERAKKTVLAALGYLALAPLLAWAHVVVAPAQVGIGRFQTFTVGVPVEKNAPTVGLRLLIPEGMQAVLPTVKPGWKIRVKKAPAGAAEDDAGHYDARTIELEWAGGTIPPGQRDEFSFSAKVPSMETVLHWKAYQYYADGSVVAWDADPKAEQPKNADGARDFSRSGPWSQTRVINDLRSPVSGNSYQLPLWLAAVAVILALVAVFIAWSGR